MRSEILHIMDRSFYSTGEEVHMYSRFMYIVHDMYMYMYCMYMYCRLNQITLWYIHVDVHV